MKVKNKWNGHYYMVKDQTDKEVTLEREDKTSFTIARSEFQFSYRKVENKA